MTNEFHFIDYLVLIVYLAAMVGIGFYFSRKEGSTERFFVGNRNIAWWAVGISIFATQLSAITYISIPGMAFENDWAWLLYNLGIPIVGVFVIYYFLPVYRQKHYTSIYQILEERFGPETRAYGALAYILMQVGRVAIVLYLPALALSEVTGFSVYWMIILMGILATAYTVMGGIEVVIWTDVVQAFVLVLGAIMAIVIVCMKVDGGFFGIIEIGQANHKFAMVHTDASVSKDLIWFILLGAFFTNLVPYASDQTVVQRYFTVKTDREARNCLWLSVLVAAPASLLFFFLGTALFAFYTTHPGLLETGIQYDRIFPFFIVNEIPVGISGLLIAAIFAGSMSSLDSSLNSIATVCVTDFYYRFRNPQSSDQQRLRLARVITIVVGVFATGLAIGVAQSLLNNPEQKGAWDLFIAVQGLLGGVLTGIFCVGRFTKTANQVGVVAGLVLSTAIIAIIKYEFVWHTQTYAAVGIISAFSITYLFSWITNLKPKTG
ncbi:MAG: sodium:solute symporter [Candidatus Hinthialibacter antarcticus]|nr:sodium:solute symporter [Candidatus Hinthialibacter antarcticus]